MAESDDLRKRAGELEAEAWRLQAEARDLRAKAELARRREHRERLEEDPLYREEVQQAADRYRAEALERLDDALDPVYVPQPYPSTRRVVSKDTIRTLHNGETVTVSRREYENRLSLSHTGPRGGDKGAFELGDGDAQVLAELIEDFIRRYPGACTSDPPKLLLTAEASSDRTWEISIASDSMGSYVNVGWVGYDAITMWAGALRPLVALLRAAG